MLPFTVEQFLNIFAEYNHAVWPTPVILVRWLAAGAAIVRVL